MEQKNWSMVLASGFGSVVLDRLNAPTGCVRILYKFIMGGGLGDPKQHEDTLKRLLDQISGVNLGV